MLTKTLIAFSGLITTSVAAVQYAGVNEAGLEFGLGIYGPTGPMPGNLNQHYFAPNPEAVQHLGSRHASLVFANLFRLNFAWERLQPNLYGPLDNNYLALLDNAVNSMIQNGRVAVLDVHNYARYRGQLLGSQIPAAALADLWTKIANHYRNRQNIWFGLMNEPHGIDTQIWFNVAQDAINAIRQTGSTNTITVPGNCFSGAHSWVKGQCDQGVPNGVAALGIKDPANNVVFEMHQYLDVDMSGTHTECTQDGPALMQDAANWLRQNGKKAFLGEIGVAANDRCMRHLDNTLSFMDRNSDVFVGYAAWAAGSAWGNYMYTLEPGPGMVDKPQISVLAKHRGTKNSRRRRRSVALESGEI